MERPATVLARGAPRGGAAWQPKWKRNGNGNGTRDAALALRLVDAKRVLSGGIPPASRTAAAWQSNLKKKKRGRETEAKRNTGRCARLEVGGRQGNDQRRKSARVANRGAAA